MSKRSDRRRQFQFESLERRETPSAVAGGTVQDLARSAGARLGEIHVSAEGTVSGFERDDHQWALCPDRHCFRFDQRDQRRDHGDKRESVARRLHRHLR